MRWGIAILVAISTTVFAVQLDEMSFDEKVRESSVVLIGVVELATPHERNKFEQEFASIVVETALKGRTALRIRVETYGEVAELAVPLKTGRRYLFFLRPQADYYESVNGRFGAIPVDGMRR